MLMQYSNIKYGIRSAHNNQKIYFILPSDKKWEIIICYCCLPAKIKNEVLVKDCMNG